MRKLTTETLYEEDLGINYSGYIMEDIEENKMAEIIREIKFGARRYKNLRYKVKVVLEAYEE